MSTTSRRSRRSTCSRSSQHSPPPPPPLPVPQDIQQPEEVVNLLEEEELMEYDTEQQRIVHENKDANQQLRTATLKDVQRILESQNIQPSTSRVGLPPGFGMLPSQRISPNIGRARQQSETSQNRGWAYPDEQNLREESISSWEEQVVDMEIFHGNVTAAGGYTKELESLLNNPNLTRLAACRQLRVIEFQISELQRMPRGTDLQLMVLARTYKRNLQCCQAEIEERFPKDSPMSLPLPSFADPLPMSVDQHQHSSRRNSVAAQQPVLEQAQEQQQLLVSCEEIDRLARERMEEIRRLEETARQQKILMKQFADEAAKAMIELKTAENAVEKMRNQQRRREETIENTFQMAFEDFSQQYIQPIIRKEEKKHEAIKRAQETPKSVMLTPLSGSCLFCNGKHLAHLCYNTNTLEARLEHYADNAICITCAEAHDEGTPCPHLPAKNYKWFTCYGEDHHSNLCPNANYPITKGITDAWYTTLKERKEILRNIGYKRK